LLKPSGKDKTVTEKRRFERMNTPLETRYTKSQGHATISSLSQTKDISRNGLCSKLSKVVNVKDTILMEIRFADKQRIAALARVVWLRPDPRNCNNICGLRFVWISSREILDERLSSLRDEVEAIIKLN
jgi:c-di-GMP-binding flagellar brake protein YcgR